MSHAHVADGTNMIWRVVVVTLLYPVHHPLNLDIISCLLDENRAGFTVTGGPSTQYLNSPGITKPFFYKEHENEFFKFVTAHMVHTTFNAKTPKHQLK